jgi:MSHA biogenesis protein MshJ
VNARLAALSSKIAALTLRERAMVGAAGLAAIGLLGWSLAVDPDHAAIRATRARMADHQTELGRFAQQRGELIAKLAVTPDELQRRELAALDTQVHALDARIDALARGLVPASKMVDTLRGLLGRTPGVRVVAVTKRPPQPLVGAPPAPDDADAPATPAATPATTPPPVGIWKHGLEIEVEGRYGDLAATVARIDALPARVLWSATRIDTVDWPKARMRIVLYTLSLDDRWLVL